MRIEDYIPVGYKNRISRETLISMTNQNDRQNRQDIEDALLTRSVLIVNIDNGYFIPDGSLEDSLKAKAYLAREWTRTKSCYSRYMAVKKCLADNQCGQISLSDFGIV